LAAAVEGEYELLIVVDHDLSNMLTAKELVKLDQNCGYILYLTTHVNRFCAVADDVIPLTMWAERAGSYTNFQGRVQKTAQCFEPREMALSELEVWSELGELLGKSLPVHDIPELFNTMGEQIASFKGLTWEGLGKSGQMLAGVPEPAYRKVRTKTPLAAY
jgi:predicted molibdopterin-dependent oxidoreductase YjgC